MTNERIIQIIPAPADMWVKEKDEETGGDLYYRAVCLASIDDVELPF